ncbi:hypothetical protein yaldo0001_3230 [Yersinia aldovae ATCC 35236]|nr:hypothetical protein yaldo0001_3230 [Yersinia aldovae ATCC 35236]
MRHFSMIHFLTSRYVVKQRLEIFKLNEIDKNLMAARFNNSY